MYKRDIPTLPKEIRRDKFVNSVFEIGYQNYQSCHTMVTAVLLGDRFVESKEPRTLYLTPSKETILHRQHKREKWEAKVKKLDAGSNTSDHDDDEEDEEEEQELSTELDKLSERFSKISIQIEDPMAAYPFMSEPMAQIYSIELAHVVVILASKYYEDCISYDTDEALYELENRYIIKMEWEVYTMLKFQITVPNFTHVIYAILSEQGYSTNWYFGSLFKDLIKEVCLYRELLQMSPATVILGIVLLYRRGKLAAVTKNKQRIFLEIMQRTANDYEVELSSVLKEYIRHKQES